jgi:hypothetical protein
MELSQWNPLVSLMHGNKKNCEKMKWKKSRVHRGKRPLGHHTQEGGMLISGMSEFSGEQVATMRGHHTRHAGGSACDWFPSLLLHLLWSSQGLEEAKQMKPPNLELSTSKPVSWINFLFVESIQAHLFCYSKRKWTNTYSIVFIDWNINACQSFFTLSSN